MRENPVTKEIQAIILTIQNYAKFLRHYHYSVLGDTTFDWWKETEKLYNTLPLPKEMNKSSACFDSAMRYEIDETTNVLFDDLPKKYTFSF